MHHKSKNAFDFLDLGGGGFKNEVDEFHFFGGDKHIRRTWVYGQVFGVHQHFLRRHAQYGRNLFDGIDGRRERLAVGRLPLLQRIYLSVGKAAQLGELPFAYHVFSLVVLNQRSDSH